MISGRTSPSPSDPSPLSLSLSMKADLDDAVSESNRLSSLLIAVTKERGELRETLNEQTEKHQSMSDVSKAEVMRQEQVHDNMQTEIESLQSHVAHFTEEITGLSVTLRQLHDEKETLQASLADAHTEVKKSEHKQQVAEELIKELTEGRKSALDEASMANSEIGELEEQLSAMKTTANREIGELEKQLSGMKTTLEVQSKQFQDMESARVLKNESNENESNVNNLHDCDSIEVEALQNVVSGLKGKLAEHGRYVEHRWR